MMAKINKKFDIKIYTNQRFTYNAIVISVEIQIADYNSPSPRDRIFINLSSYDQIFYDHGCQYGTDRSFGCPGGDFFGSSYETPTQILHAINLLLNEKYLTDITGIEEVDLSALNKQLLIYQLRTGEVHLISPERIHRFVLQVILDELYPTNPNIIVPQEIHRRYFHLIQVKTQKLLSIADFKMLTNQIENILLDKQDPTGQPAIYLNIINGLKRSGLFLVEEKDIEQEIDLATTLPASLSQLISSYVGSDSYIGSDYYFHKQEKPVLPRLVNRESNAVKLNLDPLLRVEDVNKESYLMENAVVNSLESSNTSSNLWFQMLCGISAALGVVAFIISFGILNVATAGTATGITLASLGGLLFFGGGVGYAVARKSPLKGSELDPNPDNVNTFLNFPTK